MRKQCNARIDSKLVNLMLKDATKFNKPVWAFVERAVREFYGKGADEREQSVRDYAPRKGGRVGL